MTERTRIEIKCPFCQKTEATEATEECFDTTYRDVKGLVGVHIMVEHPDRILEIAVTMAGPLQAFIRARMDGTRREGRALTDLQKAANPLNLGR